MIFSETKLGVIHNGDCLDVMKELPDNSVSSIVTDPPYGLKFMDKKWDYDVPSVEIWKEALRVLKPGGHIIVACGTRTQHRMAVNLEDAGFEIRDIVAWVYGGGFPKSLDVSKAIDKHFRAERKIIGSKIELGVWSSPKYKGQNICYGDPGGEYVTEPSTNEARQWEGWGTALKPSMELWTLCRKPISEKNIAENVLKWGCGGLNIDGCRVGTHDNCGRPQGTMPHPMDWGNKSTEAVFKTEGNIKGRFPANLIHDGSEEVLKLFPVDASKKKFNISKRGPSKGYSGGLDQEDAGFSINRGDFGSAARFFKTCQQEEVCSLCHLTLHQKHDIKKENNKGDISCKKHVKNVEKSLKPKIITTSNGFVHQDVLGKPQQESVDKKGSSHKSAQIVEKNFGSTKVIKENIAHKNVLDLQTEKLVHFVKFAGNLCDTCTIDIVQNLVAISESRKGVQNQVESQVIQDFIGNYRKCTLLLSLANYVEQMDSIDTTQTTRSLLKLFGYVLHAIKSSILEIEKSVPKRLIYQAKASTSERNLGCYNLDEVENERTMGKDSRDRPTPKNKNIHPTVKPLSLMQYLIQLVCPPKDGVILDPFLGSGTTALACEMLNVNWIGIEKDEYYCKIAKSRLSSTKEEKTISETVNVDGEKLKIKQLTLFS